MRWMHLNMMPQIFLTKPVSYERFLLSIKKAQRNYNKKGVVLNAMDEHIFIKVGSKLIKLELKIFVISRHLLIT